MDVRRGALLAALREYANSRSRAILALLPEHFWCIETFQQQLGTSLHFALRCRGGRLINGLPGHRIKQRGVRGAWPFPLVCPIHEGHEGHEADHTSVSSSRGARHRRWPPHRHASPPRALAFVCIAMRDPSSNVDVQPARTNKSHPLLCPICKHATTARPAATGGVICSRHVVVM